MKKIIITLFTGVVIFGTSCKKYLDINDNPNQATSATAELLLPQALTGTASNLNGFNTMGAQLVGYAANAGGYGGFGTAFTYNFSSGDFSGAWSNTYDNLEDYQTVLNKTDGDASHIYFNAVARIMKALSFQLLVDTYNDVPYTEALQGADNLTPAYTDAKVIYKDLADELDKAIADIHTGLGATGVTELGTSDVMFDSDMTKWIEFANTLKLRIILRSNGKITFSNTTFDAAGFLTEDALINPGYTRDNGRQNPKWSTYGYTYTGGDGATKAWMPNVFVFSFYNGGKLTDDGRAYNLFYQYPSTGINRVGIETNGLISSPSGSFWYPSDERDGTVAGNTTGVLKGPDAGFPVITAAESYFMQAEAAVRGIVTGDAAALFNSGIVASFHYIYELPDGTIDASYSGDPDADAATYMDDNSSSPLVNFALATSDEQKIEAIITQKYIALDMVNSDQSWNDYRRTHYPTIVSDPGATGIQTFASSVSESTRPDHLPTRILYPTSEGQYNSANVPKNISPFTSMIFWAL